MNESDASSRILEERYQNEFQKYNNLKRQLEERNDFLADLQKEVAALEIKNAQMLKSCQQEHSSEYNEIHLQVKAAQESREEKRMRLQELQKQIEDLEAEAQTLLQDNKEISMNSTNNTLSESMLEFCIAEKIELENLKQEIQENLEFTLAENAILTSELEIKQNNIKDIEQQIREIQSKCMQPADVTIKNSNNVETDNIPASLYNEMEKKSMESSQHLKKKIDDYKSVQSMKTFYEKKLDMFKGQFDVLKASSADLTTTHEALLRNSKKKLLVEIDTIIKEVMKATAAVNVLQNTKQEQASFVPPPDNLQYFVPMIKQAQTQIHEHNHKCLKQKQKQIEMYDELLKKLCLLYRTERKVLEQKLKNLIYQMEHEDNDPSTN